MDTFVLDLLILGWKVNVFSDYTNSISRNEYENNDKAIPEYFQ